MRNPFGSDAVRRRSSSIDRTKITVRGGVAAAPVVATPAPVPTVIYASTGSLDAIGNLDDDYKNDSKRKRHLFTRAVAVRARLSKSNKAEEARQVQSQARSIVKRLVKETPPPPVEQVDRTPVSWFCWYGW